MRRYNGTSTETIARGAGGSQPYLFRLFGDKAELCRYRQLLADPTSGEQTAPCQLNFQLQMYAGAVGDEAEPQLVQSGRPSSGEDAVA